MSIIYNYPLPTVITLSVIIILLIFGSMYLKTPKAHTTSFVLMFISVICFAIGLWYEVSMVQAEPTNNSAKTVQKAKKYYNYKNIPVKSFAIKYNGKSLTEKQMLKQATNLLELAKYTLIENNGETHHFDAKKLYMKCGTINNHNDAYINVVNKTTTGSPHVKIYLRRYYKNRKYQHYNIPNTWIVTVVRYQQKEKINYIEND